jgi:predicted ATPase/transcriptional regulator with XRE-family HTH domain
MSDDEIVSFGYWVRRRRKALDLTQQQLADQVGCAAVTIRTIESGARNPSEAMAERLALCLELEGTERAAFLRAAHSVIAVDDLPSPVVSAPALSSSLTRLRAEPPAAPNRLIGRARELAQLGALIKRPSVRLVTLTGPGGIGKTRLLAAISMELRDTFADGVAYVSLAHVVDPGGVAAAIIQVLGLPEIGSHPAVDRLVLALSGRELLLALDNFEQILDAAPQIAQLLAAAPRLRIIVTSRAALHISGEYEVAIAPLALPNTALRSDRAPDVALLRDSPAVQLFLERVRAVRPDFVLTDQHISEIASICARLDGLPLAIELAAARTALLTPQALLARLDRRLALLVGGPRDLPARQQTLRATIDWSYDLLSLAEQTLLMRLSVFVGSFSLDAVEAVCGDGASIDTTLQQLIDHSMVVRGERGDEPRYSLLELIREYAGERLVDTNEQELLRERHAAFFLELAERAAPRLFGQEQTQWLDRLQVDWPNLRVALEWGAAPAGSAIRSGILARLAVSLWWFWYMRGLHAEGRSWLEQAAATSDSQSAARAGYCAGALAFRQGEYRRGAELAGRSLLACQTLGDTLGVAYAQGVLALLAVLQGDTDTADSLAHAAEPTLAAAGHRWGMAITQIILGTAARFRGNHKQAQESIATSLELFREIGDTWGIATALGELGVEFAAGQGNWSRASEFFEESLAIFRRIGDRAGVGHALHRLGRAARIGGEYSRSLSLLREQFALFRSLGDQTGRAYALWEAAALCTLRGRYYDAARLFGLAEAHRAALNLSMAADTANYAMQRAAVQDALGGEEFLAALADGRNLEIDTALALLPQ